MWGARNQTYWVDAFDLKHLLQDLFSQAPELITPDVFYNIARNFVHADKNLFDISVKLDSARDIVNQ